jgi:hypothetical protein
MPVTGFEKQTHNLNEFEMKLIPKAKLFLSIAVKDKPISSYRVILMFKSDGITVSGPRIRKLVNYIRTEVDNGSKVLAANSNGYFWTDDIKEIARYSESLRNRMNEVRRVLYHISKSLQNIESDNETKDPTKAQEAAAEKKAIDQTIQGKLFQ